MHLRHSQSLRLPAALGVLLLAAATACTGNGRAPSSAANANSGRITQGLSQTVSLTAQPMTTALRDGTASPMWGFCQTGATGCAPGGAWAPGPTLVAAGGDTLSITLTNNLKLPTSLVILGQIGGGVGSPTMMAGPVHSGQSFTTFPGNGAADTPFVPPAQGPRVRSFGQEVGPGTTATLTWNNLKPGTYIYETGTLPSLEVPMGLYGVLVVTTAPTATAAGTAYPGVSYDDEVALLLSEMDPVQNAAVDVAANAGADLNFRNDPRCAIDNSCKPAYPAAVNYTPTYFFINGQAFDRTAPQLSQYLLGDTAAYRSGNMLVRLLNAGSRTHVPTIVGAPGMRLVAEDGNLAPGNPKGQSEVLLTAGKTLDVLMSPPASASGSSYASGTYPVFDRSLSLSTDNHPNGGMQGFILVNHAAAPTTQVTVGGVTTTVPVPGAPGNLPTAVAAAANPDSYNVPYNGSKSGDVTANDVGVSKVALSGNVSHGTLSLLADGRFTYTPTKGYSGTDQFTYVGNSTLTATVTLNVGAKGGPPVANADTFSSNVAGKFSTPRPGVLWNDTDPNQYLLTACVPDASGACPASAISNSTCSNVTLNPDGSFSATASGASCQFSYRAVNSQGTQSASTALVTISFGAASNLAVSVVDATDGTAIGDYRWTLQEDLTFKTDQTATPSVSTRTIGTSFHRSHMTVVATGCVGAVSCGAGQSVRGVVQQIDLAAVQTLPSSVSLDPSKRYYISILPGDAGNPAGGCDPTTSTVCAADGSGHIMGGAEIKPLANGTWGPLTIKLQKTPLQPAQLSIFIYEDNAPTNGQNDLNENGLGGFNIILMDPAGRTGDVAGQQTYDAFNMPLSNALLGRPGCPDELNRRTNGNGTTPDGNLVGAVYTCPNAPPGYTGDPARYALAGHALIKNLTPARYDVIAHPAAAREGAGEIWWQTETLEGTPAQDAFVGINEPVYFQEFGPPGFHTTVGFVNPGNVAAYATANHLTGGATITGKITNQHMSHPSDVTLWDSTSYAMLFSTTCQVALNSQAGDGPAIATAQCDPDGNFTLTGIPAGSYEVAVFDQWLDQIIQTVAVNVPTNTSNVNMGNLPVLSWFTQYDQNIYQDLNKNGVYDDGEPGISNVPLTVRYRNGAPSNATLSDSAGNGILVELFPLFNWYVAEADTTRYKQTGVHIWVDGGGKPDTSGIGQFLWSSTYPTGESSERLELPGALSYGVQSFISQRNRVDWGRTPYVPNENGGIYGNVVYSSTRPFDDQRLNVQTIWEPLVPRVTVNLYEQKTLPDGSVTLHLVDSTKTSSWDDWVNRVYGADNNQYLLGPDQTLRNPDTGALAPPGAYKPGRQVNMQCPGQLATDPFVNYTLGANDRQRCYDGFHNWNQVQAAPYDGRYLFPSAAYIAANPLTAAEKAAGKTLVSLPPGTYVVEAVTPPGYEIVKEEDKNILIGDAFNAPATQQFGPLGSIFILPDQATLNNANPYNPNTGDPGFQSDPTTNLGIYETSTGTVFPDCVGNLHRVPDFLTVYPQAQQVAPFAGMDRPLCDRKRVVLNDQMQTSANFFVFTPVPLASNNTGIILDDASSEFNAIAPDFGEKASVPFVPVSIKDFAGLEISRTYSDQWGAYNMMTPSSWLVNPPTPSGYGPNMLVTCMNDPGPIPDPAGTIDPATGKIRLIIDPAYNPSYSNFCYTNPFMPGQTTYLDTPVLPIAAFAAGYNPPDCSQPDNAPVIKRVDTSAGFGPYLTRAGGTLTITAEGDQQVINPAYAGPFATGGLASQRTLTRHYGFGSGQGTVKIGDTDLTGAITSWTDQSITVNVPSNTPGGELVVTTAAGRSSVDAVTVTIQNAAPTRVNNGQSIQAAVDAASPGALILIDAGVYNELVIMWKPVRLQGVGASSVIINAAKYPTSKLEVWRPRINALFSVDPTTGALTTPAQVDPLPTQEITGGVVLLEPTVLGTEEGAGITVLAKDLPANQCLNANGNGGPTSTYGRRVRESNFRCAQSRIDGISVTGGDAGGGIYVNGWAHGLEISNNRVYGNAGAFHGGIRVGVPYLELEALPGGLTGGRINGLAYDENVRIHHNSITKNGTVEGPAGQGGAGGGLSLCTGTDHYSVDHNFICGNYSSSDGGGIGHLGFSQGGVIAFNQILFNQSFQQTSSTHGGGIFVGGEPPVAGAVTLGTGDVTIDANVIRGNFAEGGQGGGLRFQQVNGADATAFPNLPARWHQISLTNNIIDNNVAGWAGGGVSLADTLRAAIVNTTVASNDSTGIAGVVLAGGVALPAETPGQAGRGTPGPAGIVSEPTSAALLGQLSIVQRLANQISQPTALSNNILWQNRSFYYSGDGRLCVGNSVAGAAGNCTVLPDQNATGQCPTGASYWDLGVLGDASANPGARRLIPTYSIITSTAGYGTTLPHNTSAPPGLVSQYCNGARAVVELGSVINPPNVMNLQVAATVDEGNNYVNLRYGPLFVEHPISKALIGNYHLSPGASAINTGTSSGAPNHDFDNQARPSGGGYDKGADEWVSGPVQPFLAATTTTR